MKTLPSSDQLRDWIETSLKRGENVLATSNQGTILLYRQGDTEVIIKAPMGRWLLGYLRHKTLKREFHAYLRMRGLKGIPACYGFLDGRYLLLEHVRGKPYRQAEIVDREAWFAQLLEILRAIHGKGIAHGDLKSKGNLLVTDDQQPCVVDFGTSFIEKKRFAPINNWFFRMARRLDINAWVKHKYHGNYSAASPEDAALLDYGWLETVVRKVRGRPMETVFGRTSSPAAKTVSTTQSN